MAFGMVAPLALGTTAPGFYVEVLLGGLMSGVMYSLVALGFVLIFKASGVFNFAQGAMVLFAALSVARIAEVMPLPLAFVLTVGIMALLAWLIERLVLRHLVNQDAVVAADGDAGSHLLPRRLRTDRSGAATSTGSTLACRRRRCWSPTRSSRAAS